MAHGINTYLNPRQHINVSLAALYHISCTILQTSCIAHHIHHESPIIYIMHRTSYTSCIAHHIHHASHIIYFMHRTSYTSCIAHHVHHVSHIIYIMHRTSYTSCIAHHAPYIAQQYIAHYTYTSSNVRAPNSIHHTTHSSFYVTHHTHTQHIARHLARHTTHCLASY